MPRAARHLNVLPNTRQHRTPISQGTDLEPTGQVLVLEAALRPEAEVEGVDDQQILRR